MGIRKTELSGSYQRSTVNLFGFGFSTFWQRGEGRITGDGGKIVYKEVTAFPIPPLKKGLPVQLDQIAQVMIDQRHRLQVVSLGAGKNREPLSAVLGNNLLGGPILAVTVDGKKGTLITEVPQKAKVDITLGRGSHFSADISVKRQR